MHRLNSLTLCCKCKLWKRNIVVNSFLSRAQKFYFWETTAGTTCLQITHSLSANGCITAGNTHTVLMWFLALKQDIWRKQSHWSCPAHLNEQGPMLTSVKVDKKPPSIGQLQWLHFHHMLSMWVLCCSEPSTFSSWEVSQPWVVGDGSLTVVFKSSDWSHFLNFIMARVMHTDRICCEFSVNWKQHVISATAQNISYGNSGSCSSSNILSVSELCVWGRCHFDWR